MSCLAFPWFSCYHFHALSEKGTLIRSSHFISSHLILDPMTCFPSLIAISFLGWGRRSRCSTLFHERISSFHFPFFHKNRCCTRLHTSKQAYHLLSACPPLHYLPNSTAYKVAVLAVAFRIRSVTTAAVPLLGVQVHKRSIVLNSGLRQDAEMERMGVWKSGRVMRGPVGTGVIWVLGIGEACVGGGVE